MFLVIIEKFFFTGVYVCVSVRMRADACFYSCLLAASYCAVESSTKRKFDYDLSACKFVFSNLCINKIS